MLAELKVGVVMICETLDSLYNQSCVNQPEIKDGLPNKMVMLMIEVNTTTLSSGYAKGLGKPIYLHNACLVVPVTTVAFQSTYNCDQTLHGL
jgi:hypothetical protein